MYNNNSNQMYTSNMHTSRSADALLKDLGAEPLFSSINNPAPGIPVPLIEQNNYNPSPAPYNNFNSVQSEFSEAFFSLLQKLNSHQQNNLNLQNLQNLQNTQNTQNIQNIQNQQQPIQTQIFGQGIQQQQQQPPLPQPPQPQTQPQNRNLNQSSLSNSNLPNPISILNEMHQRNRGSGVPPTYNFTMDSNTGYFYCQLEVFGKIFKTERPTLRKQQAKEDAALMALRNLVNNSSDGNRRVLGSDIMKLYEPSSGNYYDNRTEIISKSESWYNKQLQDFPTKQPRVILLEFCQMHRLQTPTYQPLNDYNGHTYFECRVGDRVFKSDRSFIKSSEAKDYVAHIAFGVLFREMCEKEKKNDVGQVDAKSIVNYIENHILSSPSSNINSPHSNINSPHSNFGSPHSNISNISSNISNISNIGNQHSHLNSPHSDVKLNINSSHIGSSHLNVTNPYSNFNNPPPNPSHLSSLGVTGSHNPQSVVTNSHLNLSGLHSSNLHSNVTNPHNSHSVVTNSYSSVTSPHNPQSSITNPHLNMSNPHTNVNNSHLFMGNSHSNVDSPLAANITSSHPHFNNPHHTNTNNSHLNEITSGLVLPSVYNHEATNIKVEETNPLSPPNLEMPNIKPEERDQLQSNIPASSSFSYHPYRAVGRERFPQNPSYNSTQFTKKNTGFCKKFTSLLYEMSQSKRWTPPEFNFENGTNGFVCVCSVQDYLFKGKACSRKADAKESAAEEAYRFLARVHRG